MAKLTLCAIFIGMYFASSILSDFSQYATMQGVVLTDLDNHIVELQKEKYISYETMNSYLIQLGNALNDPCLGLHLGEQLSLKVTAYVDSIMQHSQTLEASFQNASEYSKLISDALTTELHKTDHYYSAQFDETPSWSVHQLYARRQIMDLTLLSCLKSVVAYTKNEYYPSKIYFQLPKPQKINEYYRVFNCHLEFNHPTTEIFFQKQIFDRHSHPTPIGLVEQLKVKVEREMSELHSDHPLIHNVKKCILSSSPNRITADQTAAMLNISRRTLQRNLKALNTSYKELEYSLKLRLAKTYLEEDLHSIDEISYLLGFSESSAFIRFFKSQTGETPMRFKRDR